VCAASLVTEVSRLWVAVPGVPANLTQCCSVVVAPPGLPRVARPTSVTPGRAFGCAYWEVRLSEFRDSRRCPLATMIYPLVLVMSHLPPPATPLCFLEAHPAPDRYKNGVVIGSR
jgi:hypothetical protein